VSATGRTAVAALAVLAAVGGCATQPPRSAAERAADAALVARVERALVADPGLYARHVDVDAERGIVYLSGYVWSARELYAARQDAAAVPGVSRVDSELELMVGGRNGR